MLRAEFLQAPRGYIRVETIRGYVGVLSGTGGEEEAEGESEKGETRQGVGREDGSRSRGKPALIFN